MASLPSPNPVTYEEWLEMPEVEDGIEEVIDGEIIFIPPAKNLHARIVNRLISELLQQLNSKEYFVFTGSFGLVIREKPLTCRNPDLAVFQRATLVQKDGYMRPPPQLAVEVLSPSERRSFTARKLQDYEDVKTPEVWVISPRDRTVEIYLLEGETLERTAIVSAGLLKPQA